MRLTPFVFDGVKECGILARPARGIRATAAVRQQAWIDAQNKAMAEMMHIVREHLPLDVVALAMVQSRTPAEETSAP